MPRRHKTHHSPEIAEAFAAALVLSYLAVQYVTSGLGLALFCFSGVALVAALGLLLYKRHVERVQGVEAPAEFDTRELRRFGSFTGEPSTVEELVERMKRTDALSFERIVAVTYRKAGFQIERGAANAADGIDLVLRDLTGFRTGVTCKRWRTRNASSRTVREFTRALKHAGLERGIFIALRGHSGEAQEMAEENGVDILNEIQFINLLQSTEALSDAEIRGALRVSPDAPALRALQKSAL